MRSLCMRVACRCVCVCVCVLVISELFPAQMASCMAATHTRRDNITTDITTDIRTGRTASLSTTGRRFCPEGKAVRVISLSTLPSMR